jgi:hypothetical protein
MLARALKALALLERSRSLEGLRSSNARAAQTLAQLRRSRQLKRSRFP